MNDPITKVSLGRANAYLIKTDIGFILVDAGPANKTEKLITVLDSLNADITEIDLIIVTHAHSDHVGSLAEIKNKAEAPVLIHRREQKKLAQGQAQLPPGTGLVTRLLAKVANNLFSAANKFTPVEADLVIEEKFDLADYGITGEVVTTPGHTSGSVSVIINGRYCICGDLMANIGLNNIFPPFAADRETLIASWQLIKEYNCTNYYPGHGQEFAQDKFKAAVIDQMNS